MRRSTGTRSATLRRTCTSRVTMAGPGSRSSRQPMRKASAATRTSSRKTRSAPTCCSSARNSACGSRSTAAGSGPSSSPAGSPRWRSATSRSIRATTTSCSPRMGAASGSWTTSRRLRDLSPELLAKPAAFVAGRPAQQRISGPGGWANGAAVFVGDNPTSGAVINYYQKSRHLFGKLKIEVLDPDGKVIDELPASPRRGLNRVDLVHAREGAARAAGGPARRRRHTGAAGTARHVHGANDQGRRDLRGESSRSNSTGARPTRWRTASCSTTPRCASPDCSARKAR